MSFVKLLKTCDDYMELGGVSESEIEHAERVLGVLFAKEYKEYLLQCGVATANGHEFTGICNSKRLNVVDVTILERKSVKLYPEKTYVVEQTHVDGTVIWQGEDGIIYITQNYNEVTKLCDNLLQYLEM